MMVNSYLSPQGTLATEFQPNAKAEKSGEDNFKCSRLLFALSRDKPSFDKLQNETFFITPNRSNVNQNGL